MSNTIGPSLLRLGVILLMACVISLSVVFLWFSISNCPSRVFRPDQYSQINFAKSNKSLTEKAEEKPIWPENSRFEFSDFKKFYNIDNCHLTDDRALYSESSFITETSTGICPTFLHLLFFVPAESFIHVNDFPDAKSLAEYLHQLDKDEDAYRKYFNWRKYLTPTPHLILQTQEFALPVTM